MFLEPTSKRAMKLLIEAKKEGYDEYKTVLYVAGRLADEKGRVHMNYMDLVGLILNINRHYDK